MYIKKIIFVIFVVTLVESLFWTFGKFFNSDMSELSRQTYSIMAGVKFLIAITLYIAWRVTPESKNK